MTYTHQDPIAIIGCGNVGGAIAIALSRAGYHVVSAASRTFSSAVKLVEFSGAQKAYESIQDAVELAEVIFITTPDDFIKTTAESIAWRPRQAVIHCSGAASLDVFDNILDQKINHGALHPLQAFSSIHSGADSISGITFGVEGGKDVRPYLEQIGRDLGANTVFLKSSDKALYHLTGVLMGNLLTEYLGMAAQLWEHIGFSRQDGIDALIPMMKQVADNVEKEGIPAAVAGPYVRGDLGTITKHIDALHAFEPNLIPFYCQLALVGFGFAEEKGTLTSDQRSQIRSMLNKALVETKE